jgi:hypothetical protein
MSQARALFAANIQQARNATAPLPLVMGEFGVQGLSESDAAWFYRTMYAELRLADIGSLFWDLSVSERSFGVLNTNGSLTPAADAIAQAMMANHSGSNT